MKYSLTIGLIIVFLSSCKTQIANADNTKPMYGEVEKSNKQKVSDEKFVKTCVKQFGTIDSSIVVHLDEAWRYYYNNDFNTAMKRFNQVWLLNNEYPDSYFGFASISESKGNLKDVKRFYEIGIQKDSNKRRSENCYQLIADCKEQLGDIEGATNAYIAITDINPNNALAFKKIGYFKMEKGNTTEALQAYKKAIELDPKDAMTFNNRAYLNQTLKNFEEAINDYTEAIKLNPEFIRAIVNRGITKMKINKFKEAKKDFELCIKFDSTTGELRRFLALSQLRLNEKSEACNNLEKAIELGDEDAIQIFDNNCSK